MTAVRGSIRFLKDRLRGFDVMLLIVNTIENNSAELIKLNQIQLYRSSVDAFGNKLSLYSSPIYAINKQRMNPLPGFLHPDLYLTGNFYRGFKVTVTRAGLYSITSTDAKTAQLTGKYGDIFGLTLNNVQIYARETFLPDFQEGFSAATGLAFG